MDVIVSSTYTRAHQTAQEIQKVTQKELVTTDLLIERKHPTFFSGKLRSDPEVMEVKTLIKQNIDNSEWHHSDEENFFDLKTRGIKALQFLIDQKKDNIVAVSHGHMLSLLAMTMMLGDKVTYDAHHTFDRFAHSTNTGITMCEYKDGTWYLQTWNDYAHLGE